MRAFKIVASGVAAWFLATLVEAVARMHPGGSTAVLDVLAIAAAVVWQARRTAQ